MGYYMIFAVKREKYNQSINKVGTVGTLWLRLGSIHDTCHIVNPTHLM